jgi:cell division protein FtsW
MEKRIDWLLLIIFLIFLILGILILTSASAPFSEEKFGNSYYYLTHQLFFGILPGLFLFFLFLKSDLNFLKKYSPLFLFINLILMVLVFIPNFGVKIRGGARWITFGPISLQPSEFLKLNFIIYLAAWLSTKTRGEKKKENFSQTFFAFLILITLISIFLISQPDISTLGIIFATSLAMFFLAKTPIWQTILIGFLALILFFPLVKFAPYRFSRILVFLNPELDPFGIGYQIRQALIAIGSGKIFGLGLGLSQQKLGILPQSFSDSIFAIFAEETGFLGCLFLISLYLLFFLRGLKIGNESQDSFEKLLAFGISFWITLQAFINIGAMIGILPLSGIPLPFISYGGSHLISEMGAIGILLKISKKP